MKTCSKCGVEKALELFEKKGNRCKACAVEYYRAYRDANPEKVRETKRTCRLKSEKIRASERAWKIANREKLREQARAWRMAHPEKFREQVRRYYEAHREEILEKQRASYAADPEKILERTRSYYAANKEKALASNRAWKAANPERRREIDRKHAAAWKAANPEKAREIDLKQKARKRALKQVGAEPGEMPEEVRELWLAYHEINRVRYELSRKVRTAAQTEGTNLGGRAGNNQRHSPDPHG